MKSRRMMLVAALLAGVALVPACNRSKSYSSPQEAFDAAQAAAAKEDWTTFSNCLTDDSRDSFAGMLAFGASFMKAFASLDKDKGSERFKAIDEVMNKHGLTEEYLKSMEKSPMGKGEADQRKMMAKLTEPIKDKTAFINDMMQAMKKVDNSGKNEKPFTGELKDLKVDGDSAKGTFISKQNGKERSEPIEFRKVGGGWKIELPMPSGPMLQAK